MANVTYLYASIVNNGTQITFYDYTQYSGGDGITEINIKVTPPSSITSSTTTLALFSQLYGTSTTSRSTTLGTSSFTGLTTYTYFPDGVYKFEVTIKASATTWTTKTFYMLVYRDVANCMYPKIANLAKMDMGECDCKSAEEKNDLCSELFAMYMQLRSAEMSLEFSMPDEATDKLETLQDYCDDCECDC